MAVRWNKKGTILLVLRNLLPLVIYDPMFPKKKLEFDSKTYFNACTMKSCSFAGDEDEFIMSGRCIKTRTLKNFNFFYLYFIKISFFCRVRRF